MSRISVRRVTTALVIATLGGLFGLRAEPTVDAARPERGTTVFVVRHAEKGDDDPRDPRLTRTGRQRAAALGRLLAHSGVTHLFSSEYRRTVETLEPLGERIGVEITIVPAREEEALVEALRGLPRGSVALVSGHSNTVPGLVRALGGRLDEETLERTSSGLHLAEDEHDRLFVVVLSPAPGRAPVTTLELRYGR